MVDFHTQRNDVEYIYRRVSFPDLREIEDIKNIKGGSLEWSAFTTLKVSAKLTFVGSLNIGASDMVRIYYRFKDASGKQYEKVLATLKMAVPDNEYDDMNTTGDIECDSVLQILESREYGMPFTVTAGTNAIAKAVQLCESVGLKTNKPKSDYAIKSDYTFDYDASYLEIVNWLCDSAGYASLGADSMGGVFFSPYIEPTEREIAVTFRDDARSIMYPRVKNEYALVDTPNVVRAFYETDKESLYACAANNDATSSASTVTRKYEITKCIKANELDGKTQKDRIKQLEKLAADELVNGLSGFEHVQLSHAWLPLNTSDAVMIAYEAADRVWRGTVTDISMDLEVDAKCDTKIRHFVKENVKVTIESGAL